MQRASGAVPDGTRSYGELSLASIGWYVGAPVVALGILGLALLTYRALSAGATGVVGLVILCAVGMPVYLWNPSITPDQLWATRRYLPLIMPAFVLAAGIAADRLVEGVRGAPWLKGAAMLSVTAAFVVPAALRTWPVRDMADQRNFYGGLMAACEGVGESAAVLQAGPGTMMMPMRAWCGADVASVSGETAPEALRQFIDRSVAACRRAFVLTEDPGRLAGLPGLGTPVTRSYMNEHLPERTLTSPPDDYLAQGLTYTLAPVVLPETCQSRV
jgi:hypothetical protein